MRASTLVSFCTQLDLRIVIVVSENAALCLNQRLSDPKPSVARFRIVERTEVPLCLARRNFRRRVRL